MHIHIICATYTLHTSSRLCVRHTHIQFNRISMRFMACRIDTHTHPMHDSFFVVVIGAVCRMCAFLSAPVLYLSQWGALDVQHVFNLRIKSWPQVEIVSKKVIIASEAMNWKQCKIHFCGIYIRYIEVSDGYKALCVNFNWMTKNECGAVDKKAFPVALIYINSSNIFMDLDNKVVLFEYHSLLLFM